MNKNWDSNKGGRDRWISWLAEVMVECLRVAKPGAMMLCWSIPRTSHWTGSAIELAGWEVRDVITHLFGSGMPKGHNISAAIDRAAGIEREIVGIGRGHTNGKGDTYGTFAGEYEITAPATAAAREWAGYNVALKPAAEFWWLAMKPIDKNFAHNALTHGVAGLWVDGCRIETNENLNGGTYSGGVHKGNTYGLSGKDGRKEPSRRLNPEDYMQPSGRWPANLVLDTEAARLLDEMSGELTSGKPNGAKRNVNGPFLAHANGVDLTGYGDTGGASRYFQVIDSEESRFFYSAKASRSERDAGLEGMPERIELIGAAGHKINPMTGKPVVDIPRANHHPTVKSLDLMKFLVRLTKTPRGGTVLDPFMGSGSTGVACMIEGRQFVGIEKEPEYVEIARHRIEHWRDEVSTEPRKIKDNATHTDLPLFTGLSE